MRRTPRTDADESRRPAARGLDGDDDRFDAAGPDAEDGDEAAPPPDELEAELSSTGPDDALGLYLARWGPSRC